MQANTMELTRTVRSMRAQMAEWTVIFDRMERELEDHQTSGHSTVMCPSSTAAEFGYEFMGQSFSAHDGADVLLLILRLFAKQAPEFPERFRRAVEPLGRTRPYAARSPETVYPGRPRLRKANSPKSLRLAGTSVPTRATTRRSSWSASLARPSAFASVGI